MSRYTHYIGIDPGVKTGFAVWLPSDQQFKTVETMAIHEAMDRIKNYYNGEKVMVVVEDARQRKWFGKAGREKLQGAGSIKRDCKIWDDFLKSLGIKYLMKKPIAGTTKWNQTTFKRHTNWQGRTNEHSRDAALLVFGRN